MEHNNAIMVRLPHLYKTFCVFVIMHILFCHTNQKKSVTDRNKRLNLRSLFINRGTLFLIPVDSVIEITCPRSYVLFLNFLSSKDNLDCFLRAYILPNINNSDLLKVSKNEPVGSISTFPKSVK